MKHIKLFEAFNVSMATKSFLRLWTNGDNSSLRYLTPNVSNELEQSVEKEKYTLYRGLKFKEEDDLKRETGKTFKDIKKGDTIKIHYDFPTSWTHSESIAKKFMNAKYNSFEDRYYEEDEIADMGYEEDELLGYGILVKHEFTKSEVLADMANIPSYLLVHDNDEEEVIVVMGTYTVEVLATDEYHAGEQDEEDDTDDDSETERNAQWQKDNHDFQEMQKAFPDVLKRAGVDVNKEDQLIKYLDDKPDGTNSTYPILMLFLYHKFPKLVEYIRDNAKKFKDSTDSWNGRMYSIPFMLQILDNSNKYLQKELGKK